LSLSEKHMVLKQTHKLIFGRHNVFSILAMMIKQEGVKTLGKGLLPALFVSTPYSVFTIFFYEKVKKWSLKEA